MARTNFLFQHPLVRLALAISILTLLVVTTMNCSPAPSTSPSGGSGPVAESEAPLLEMDCVPSNPLCRNLTVLGHAPDPGDFHGFADPAMRKDPVTSAIWMAYSWPNVKMPSSTLSVEVHLAKSDDQGSTWNYVSPLWPSNSTPNPMTGVSNFLNHEVPTIWADNSGGVQTWYAVHLIYLAKPGPSIYAQLGPTARFVVSKAATPAQLATAPFSLLGFAATNAAFPVDTNLASLSPELSQCGLFNEPAIITKDGMLYLAAQCLYAVGPTLQPQNNFYAIFSTNPSGNINNWTWKYEGKLAGFAEAQELGGHKYWVELEFSLKNDGKLLATITPTDSGTDTSGNPIDIHRGCKTVEVESLVPPRLARNATGRLKVLASVTTSDLTLLGPGACAYEPSSNTGIVITRKLINDPVLKYYWSLHKTGLFP